MSTNDPKPDDQPVVPEQQPEQTPPISYETAARAAAEADAARATGIEEGEQLADAIDQRMYFGGVSDTPGTSGETGNVPATGDPFREADATAQAADAPLPAGTVETVIDESPETPATAPPSTTTGTGSSIAIGCVAAAIVVVLIAILVLTIIS